MQQLPWPPPFIYSVVSPLIDVSKLELDSCSNKTADNTPSGIPWHLKRNSFGNIGGVILIFFFNLTVTIVSYQNVSRCLQTCSDNTLAHVCEYRESLFYQGTIIFLHTFSLYNI